MVCPALQIRESLGWACGVRVTSLPEVDAGMLSIRCGIACFGFVEGLAAPSHVFLYGAVFSQTVQLLLVWEGNVTTHTQCSVTRQVRQWSFVRFVPSWWMGWD